MKSQTTVLQVGGLNWATSAAIVEQTSTAPPGVLAVEANAVSQTANVSYDPDGTNVAQLSGWVPSMSVNPYRRASSAEVTDCWFSRARPGSAPRS